MTDPEKGPNGISAFVVEKGSPGFTVGKLEKKMGIRGSPTVELRLRRLPRPGGEPAGRRRDGFKTAMKVLDKSRPGIAAQALGIAAGALDYADRVRARNGSRSASRSAQQQGLQFMLADMKTEVEAARLLLYEAARKCDEGAADITLWAAMAKLKCRRRRDARDDRRRAGPRRLRLLGEYPVERMMRDAKITQIYEGTQQIQRIVIARSLVGRWKPPAGSRPSTLSLPRAAGCRS